MYIVIDGTDRLSYIPTIFVYKVKEILGFCIKVGFIFFLREVRENPVHWYTMSNNHRTVSNHIIG